jgi:hypothetical protein
MNGYALAALAVVCAAIVVLAFLYRRTLKIKLKAFGVNFGAEGENAAPAMGPTATASGERAAAVGGTLEGHITTGDRGATAQAAKSATKAGSSSSQTKSASTGKPKLPAGTAVASGARAAAVGGDAKGKITTGDQMGP